MNTKFFKKFTIAAIVAVLLAVSIVTAQTHGGGAWVKQETRDKWGDVVGFRYVQTVTAAGGKSNENSIGRALKIICDSEGNAAVEVSPNYDIGGSQISGFHANVSLRDANGVVHDGFFFTGGGKCHSRCNEFIDLLIKDGEYRILLEGEIFYTKWSVNATIRGGVPPEVNNKREAERKKKLQEEEAERIRLRNMSGSFTDTRDGKVYRTVKIGNQTWMAENLNYQTNNSWCYKNDESYCAKYGRLYNWNAAMKACPVGWRLSTREDWNNLVNVVGGEHGEAGRLKSKTGWITGYRSSNNATDEFGFSALPGGSRDHAGGFSGGGSRGSWWTTDHGGMVGRAYIWSISNDLLSGGISGGVGNAGDITARSIRCVEGVEEAGGADKHETFTDPRDNKTYHTVKIGKYTWMRENLNYYTLNSSCYDNNNAYCAKYGRLYNWKAAMTACPAGWRLPDAAAWNALINEVGGHAAHKKLRTTSGWIRHGFTRDNISGTDDFGFSALPGGFKSSHFLGVGSVGFWWSASEENKRRALYWSSGVIRESDESKIEIRKKSDHLSVRCVK